jgi:hypothetical protein
VPADGYRDRKEDPMLEVIVIALVLTGAFAVVHGWVPRHHP